MPLIDPTTQHRPSPSREEVERILVTIIPRFRILVALLAGTGLRIGECLGLKVNDLTEDCRVITVSRSIWCLQEQTPKTSNALRIIDIHETLARVLREYTAGKTGLLFATKKGKPLSQRNVLRALLKAGGTCGFHGFRRFRTETLRKERVPEDLIKLWMGHASVTVTDLYAEGIREHQDWRQHWCQRAACGSTCLGQLGSM